MKSKKKILASLLLVVMLLCGLSACENIEDTMGGSLGSIMEPGTSTEDPIEFEEMTVHFLDVGQGLSILVQSEGKTLVYDGGDRSASSFLVSYLKKQGVTEIEYLIASHYDEDHIAGLVGCMNAFSVKHVIGPDYVQETKIYESFINGVEAQGITVEHPSVGTEISFGTGRFTVLAPEQIYEDSNSNSVVIKLENGSNRFLFTGDATEESEAAMCDSDLDLSCEVLCISHHGSASATSWEFLQAAIPEAAVISCGLDNKYGHPDKDTMDKLETMEISVYRTDLQGTVVAVSDGIEIQWSMEPCNDYRPGDESDKGTQPTPPAEEPGEDIMVWVSETGSKYHGKPDCGKMNPDKAIQLEETDAQHQGYEPCEKCF